MNPLDRERLGRRRKRPLSGWCITMVRVRSSSFSEVWSPSCSVPTAHFVMPEPPTSTCRSTSRSLAERSTRDVSNRPSATPSPDAERVWRWTADGTTNRVVIKFELLADLDDQPAPATFRFAECEHLGAANLRGTGYAARDIAVQQLRARIGGLDHVVEVNVTGLAGFLLAKTAAAYSRRKPKDWYDISFVLLHNNHGGVTEAAELVTGAFGDELIGEIRIAIDDLHANFADPIAQGPQAYAEQLLIDHPELDEATLLADAVTAVDEFHRAVTPEACAEQSS